VLFNSYEFIFLFLPISVFVYFYLNQKRLTTLSKGWLLFISLLFYSWWNVAYLPLILISILFNYSIANSIVKYDEVKNKYGSKKLLLQIGLLFNLCLLGYFKYMDFFISNINSVLGANISLLYLALPLAISFFTLQQIAYLVDSYEGLAKGKNFLDYSIFVSFFPQLIAGPIVRHNEMMPQFFSAKNKVKNHKNIALGVFIFSIGLFKKVVLADTFAIWASAGFDSSITLNLFEAWATSLSYTFQLYFDFSGYTDMAIGAALLFNINLPRNFNSPFKATGMIDFWKRWHMTLTNFITTYIYTPIIRSFNKLTFHKAMLATVIVFLISGLWHGASWMFVIFGGLNGLGIVVNQYWKKRKVRLNKVLAWFITFNFINITFIFFRAQNWDDAIKVLGSMFSLDNIVLPLGLKSELSFLIDYGIKFDSLGVSIGGNIWTAAWIVLGLVVVLCFKNSMEKRDSFELNYITVTLSCMYFSLSILSMSRVSEFLYFNF